MGFFDGLHKAVKQESIKPYPNESVGSFLYRKIMFDDILINAFFFPEYPKKQGSDIEAIIFVSSLVHLIVYNECNNREGEIMDVWYVRMMEDLQRRGIKDYFITHNLPDDFINKRIELYYSEWLRSRDNGYAPRSFLYPFYQEPFITKEIILVMNPVFSLTKLSPVIYKVFKVVFETIDRNVY